MRTIHCPHCRVRLDVPDAAGGKAARCPACHTKFNVPDPGDMLEETVVCWLDLDRLHSEEDKEELMDATRVEAALSADPAPTDDQTEPPGGTPTDADDAAALMELADASPAVEAPPTRDLLSLDEAIEEPTHRNSGHGSFVAYEPPQASAKPVEKADDQPGASTNKSDAVGRPLDRHHAHLQVVDVGAFGVRVRFGVAMFDLPGFRASMPMKCIAGGEGTQLIARPLPWVDKATGHYVNPGEMEARYELQVKSHQSPRDVLMSMSPLDELPTPFNQPIPYYVSREKAKDVTLHCETFGTPDGVQCEVVIPSGAYALEWLGRVNGVCGEEYAKLETEVLKFEAKAWRAMPMEVRHRLAVWFDFQTGEKFIGYFNDSDFAKSEAGLAGLVLTDHRLVYCKYHHHGEFALDDHVLLAAIIDGQFADLKAKHPTGTRRMVRLRRSDAITLGNMLRKLGAKLSMAFYQPKPKPQSSEEEAEGNESVE